MSSSVDSAINVRCFISVKIDYAKKNLDAARGKVEDMWTQIMDTNDQPRETHDNSAAWVRVCVYINCGSCR